MNIAYTEAYLNYRKTLDYLFDDLYKDDEDEIKLSDGKHIIHITEYVERKNYRIMSVSKILIYDYDRNIVSEIKNIGSKTTWFSEIEHSNGKRYLIFSIDLYGYSIMDLSDYTVYHYMPKECLEGGETFIWTNAKYCKENDTLVADGCYWACSNSFEVYEFTRPIESPLNLLFTSYDLEDELNIDCSVIPLGFNDKGELIISCTNKLNDESIQKVIDISRFKS